MNTQEEEEAGVDGWVVDEAEAEECSEEEDAISVGTEAEVLEGREWDRWRWEWEETCEREEEAEIGTRRGWRWKRTRGPTTGEVYSRRRVICLQRWEKTTCYCVL